MLAEFKGKQEKTITEFTKQEKDKLTELIENEKTKITKLNREEQHNFIVCIQKEKETLAERNTNTGEMKKHQDETEMKKLVEWKTNQEDMFSKLKTQQEETLRKLVEEQKNTETEFSEKQRRSLIEIIEEQNKIKGSTKEDIDALKENWNQLKSFMNNQLPSS